MPSHGVLAAKCVTKACWVSLQTMRSQSRVKGAPGRCQRLSSNWWLFRPKWLVRLQWHGLLRPSKSKQRRWLSRPPSTLAPSCKEFSDFIGKFSQSTALTRKELRMAWCLDEGVKVLDQRAIQSASLIALMRDERHGRVAVRFRSVSSDLSVRSGFLDQGRFEGTGADDNLSKTTLNIMKRACSRWGT